MSLDFCENTPRFRYVVAALLLTWRRRHYDIRPLGGSQWWGRLEGISAANGKRLVPIGRAGTGFPQKLLKPKLRALETDKSPFSAVIPRKPQRKLHYLKPELVAEVEFTSWTGDGLLRQASPKSLHEKTDKKLRPDWINLPAGRRNGRKEGV